MDEEPPSEELLEQYLAGELRILNAHLPRRQKPLAVLMREEHPHVICHDGNPHLFRREELGLLAGFLDVEEQELLFLPMLIEVGRKPGEAELLCRGPVEEKVVSRILGMVVPCRQGRLTLYRLQLGGLRRVLASATQYVFSAGADRP